MAGLFLNIRTAGMNSETQMREGKYYPDMFIAEPVGPYSGLYIELKENHQKIYKKDGKLRKNEHTQGQYKLLRRLRSKGYKAVFACGIDEAMAVIDMYLNQKTNGGNNVSK